MRKERISGPWQKHHNNTNIEVTYMGKKGMLLVGHGSTMPYNQELVERTAEFIKEKNAGLYREMRVHEYEQADHQGIAGRVPV